MGMDPVTISLIGAGVSTGANLIGGKNAAKQQTAEENQLNNLINNPLSPQTLSTLTANTAAANDSAIRTAESRGAYGANQNAVIGNLLNSGQTSAESAAANAAAQAAGDTAKYEQLLLSTQAQNPYSGFMNSLPGLLNAYNAANPKNSGTGIPAVGSASFGTWGGAAGAGADAAAGAGTDLAVGDALLASNSRYTPNPSLSSPLNYPLYNTSSSTNPAFGLTYPMGASAYNSAPQFGNLPSLNSIHAGSTLSGDNTSRAVS